MDTLAEADLSAAGRHVVTTGLEVIDHLDRQLAPLDAYLVRFSRLQPGCRALKQRLFGVGDLIAVFIWAELGNCVRFSSSDDAVRYSGLDITVYESADKRPPGHLSRQGPEALRWALYEVAQSAARSTSPDRTYYLEVKERLNHTRACLSVEPPQPEWGQLINAGRAYIGSNPSLILFPGVALMATVLGFNLVGDFLQDLIDPRLRR